MLIEFHKSLVLDRGFHIHSRQDWRKRPGLIESLEKIPGISITSICCYDPYRLDVSYGKLFTAEEIIIQIGKVFWEPPPKLIIWYPLGK